jgi:peptidoglycan/LPS O-acetylase OafA/YrhL
MAGNHQSSAQSQPADDGWDIACDLGWIDLLKGIAIIGVLLDNWTGYLDFAQSPAFLHREALVAATAVGPWVQVFFILSGLGLTWDYLRHSPERWSWGTWACRRFTKIVLPYYALVLLSFLIGTIVSRVYGSPDLRFSWEQLLAYLTFTRNLFPETWVWNPPTWFMPVIIGLYISFPVLVLVLERWGAWVLLLAAALVSYGTIGASVLAGGSLSHGADHFTFWMLQFSLGMVLAWVRARSPQKLRYLIGRGPFALACGLLIASWWLRTYIPLGEAFNDSLTSAGIFLLLLNIVWTARVRSAGAATVLTALSSVSYYMFLIHYPLMRLLVPPALREPLNPLVVLALGGLFLALIYIIARLLSQPMNRFTSWAYRRMLSRSVV